MCLLWFYFTMSENVTVWYGNEPSEMAVFGARTRGLRGFHNQTLVVLSIG